MRFILQSAVQGEASALVQLKAKDSLLPCSQPLRAVHAPVECEDTQAS